jgi:hypothetical protein
MAPMSDPVNHPAHYHSSYIHESCGTPIECIDIVRHMDFDTGNAVKYCWRAGKKGDTIEDLEKAVWYLNDRISELKRARAKEEHAPKPEPVKIPVSMGIEVDFNTVSGGPGEYWVLYIYDIITANENWARFNRDDFFLQHPQRGAIRDAILGLITRLPTSAYDGLAPWVREAADDWTYAESVREGSC